MRATKTESNVTTKSDTTKETNVTPENVETKPKRTRKTATKKAEPEAQSPSPISAPSEPRLELRRLVRSHYHMTKMSVSTRSPAEDKKNRVTGAIIKSNVPDDLKPLHFEMSAAYKRKAIDLEGDMTRELKKLPIYKVFMREVFGLGPVVSGYLAAEVDFDKAIKPSQLKRYCGFAVINGRLERPQRGIKLGYNASLRTRIFQMMSALWKNAAKVTLCEKHALEKSHKAKKGLSTEDRKAFLAMCAKCEDCMQTSAPRGYTSKYLDVWKGYKHRMSHSERFRPESNELLGTDGEWHKGARASIHSAGWHKAADVFLEDLYIVGRTLAGLPVWPSYYAAKLGYEHLGKICVNEPKLLSLDEALALVGDVGARPLPVTASVVDEEEATGLEEEIDRAEQEEVDVAEGRI
jgi:hypothetical protein